MACSFQTWSWKYSMMNKVGHKAGLGKMWKEHRLFEWCGCWGWLSFDKVESEYAIIVVNLLKVLLPVLSLNHLIACAWYGLVRTGYGIGRWDRHHLGCDCLQVDDTINSKIFHQCSMDTKCTKFTWVVVLDCGALFCLQWNLSMQRMSTWTRQISISPIPGIADEDSQLKKLRPVSWQKSGLSDCMKIIWRCGDRLKCVEGCCKNFQVPDSAPTTVIETEQQHRCTPDLLWKNVLASKLTCKRCQEWCAPESVVVWMLLPFIQPTLGSKNHVGSFTLDHEWVSPERT